jgi:hypothetical protein
VQQQVDQELGLLPLQTAVDGKYQLAHEARAAQAVLAFVVKIVGAKGVVVRHAIQKGQYSDGLVGLSAAL